MDLFESSAVRKAIGVCIRCGGPIYPTGPIHSCPWWERARRTDPATSYEAARRVERTGKADSHRRLVVEAVRAYPGSTGAEIAMHANLERHEASRRLPECREMGLVRNGEARKCRVTGSLSLTWWTV